jgi:hypothetical protein
MVTILPRSGVIFQPMRKTRFLAPVAVGAVAGLAAAIAGDVTVFAALSVVGLSVVVTGAD